jgi:hypothetical protein
VFKQVHSTAPLAKVEEEEVDTEALMVPPDREERARPPNEIKLDHRKIEPHKFLTAVDEAEKRDTPTIIVTEFQKRKVHINTPPNKEHMFLYVSIRAHSRGN